MIVAWVTGHCVSFRSYGVHSHASGRYVPTFRDDLVIPTIMVECLPSLDIRPSKVEET
jgi:hypothetical protein